MHTLGTINNSAAIINCFNSGMVSGNSYVGGIVAMAVSGTIAKCINTDIVEGNTQVGAIVGGYYGVNVVPITDCFYDNQKCKYKAVNNPPNAGNTTANAFNYRPINKIM